MTGDLIIAGEDAVLAEREQELRETIDSVMRASKATSTRASTLKSRLRAGQDVSVEDVAHVEAQAAALVWERFVIVSQALCGRYTPFEVASWWDYAKSLGAARPYLGRGTLMELVRVEIVPTEPFRRNMQDRTDLEVVARSFGAEHYGGGCGTDLQKLVGLRTRHAREGQPPSVSLFIAYDKAVKLAAAAGMAPHEAGV